jgi:hypothetical protein
MRQAPSAPMRLLKCDTVNYFWASIPPVFGCFFVSAGSGRIPRKNVYAKMRISSQRELFSIFIRSSPVGT